MKRKLALLLAFSLVLSLVPATALLAEEDENGYEYEYNNDYNGDDEYDDYNDEDYDDDEDYNDDEDEDYNDYNDYDDEDDYNGEEDYNYYDVYPIDGDITDMLDDIYDVVDTDDVDDVNVVDLDPITDDVPVGVTTLRFVIGNTTYTRNGVAMQLDAAPFIDAAVGRTMVPLAAIGEGLGAEVGWDGEARDVIVIRGEVNVRINVDTELPGDMGTPAIVEGRTFVPLAYVASLFGADVEWDGDAQAVYVMD
jgi:hypothetical protein